MHYIICFFEQKTAYDMRNSDWSSYVCSSDLLWQNKPDGTVTWSNEGWRNYLGQPIEAIKDGGWSILHPDDAKTTRRIFESELRGTQPVTYEEGMRRTDGVYRWLLMRGRPVLNEQGDRQSTRLTSSHSCPSC